MDLQQYAREQETPVITRKALTKLGYHHRHIQKALEDGTLERLRPGHYRILTAEMLANEELLEVCSQVKQGVVCLLSALAYYGLSTVRPNKVWMAIPNHSRAPRIEFPPIRYCYFADSTHQYGIVKPEGFPIYSMEKTLADLLHHRNKVGMETVKDAFRDYLRLKNRNLHELLRASEVCHVKERMMDLLQVMV